ncbi:MAG: hypothetical protein ABIH01_01215 [Candidatus Omnitrophota bacterium]
MLNEIIQSKTRVKLLSLFLSNIEKRYYARELVRLTNEHYNAIWRELIHLEKIGLLESENNSNIKYYCVNKHFALFQELKSVVLKAANNGAMVKA